MSKKIIDTQTLTDIANAIREKEGQHLSSCSPHV